MLSSGSADRFVSITRGSQEARVTAIDFIIMLGFWLGAIALYFIHGRRIIRAMMDKVHMSMGQRYYRPHTYAQRSRQQDRSKNRKIIEKILSWIALGLVILGILNMIGVVGQV